MDTRSAPTRFTFFRPASSRLRPGRGSARVRHPKSETRNPRRAAAAFTLSEVLVAMGILALGTVAVASLFPTAAFLQKEAVKETLQQNHIRSADAILEGVGIRNAALLEFIELIEAEDNTGTSTYPPVVSRNNIEDPAFDVFALAEIDTSVWSSYDSPMDVADAEMDRGITITIPSDQEPMNTEMSMSPTVGTPDMRMGNNTFGEDDSYVYDTTRYGQGNMPLSMRSLPTTTPALNNLGTPSYVEREVYWVPLVRAGVEASELFPDWSVYVFILQPDSQLRSSNAYAMRTDVSIAVNYPGNYGDFDDPSIVCANPDQAAYVPKVFRVPAAAGGWNKTAPLEFTPDVNLFGYVKPGEKVLGDNGSIYRVSQIDFASGTMILSEELIYRPINERDLGALWVAPAPGGFNQNSPLADIRLLSNTVVRTSDF